MVVGRKLTFLLELFTLAFISLLRVLDVYG